MTDRIAVFEKKLESLEKEIQVLKAELRMMRGGEDETCLYCAHPKKQCKCEECFGCHGINTCTCGGGAYFFH
jgi:hypothetical protein